MSGRQMIAQGGGSVDLPAAGRQARLSDVKFNSLGQGQVPGPVDGAGLPPHIGFPGIASGLAPPTGILFPHTIPIL